MRKEENPCVGPHLTGSGMFTQATLDRMAARGCEDPDCSHQHDAELMEISPGCHPEAGVRVFYKYGTGVLIAICDECETQTCVARLHPGDKP